MISLPEGKGGRTTDNHSPGEKVWLLVRHFQAIPACWGCRARHQNVTSQNTGSAGPCTKREKIPMH